MHLQFHSSAPALPADADQALPRETCAGPAQRLEPAVAHGASAAAATRSIVLLSAYGEVLASAQAPASDFGAVLRTFHRRAMERLNAVVVLDGVTITRSSFLELVREFNQSAARSARLDGH